MRWDLAGQGLTVWGFVLFFAAPLIARYLRRRKANAELRARLAKPYIDLKKEDAALSHRLEPSLWVAKSEIERRRISREAAIPITQSQWQDNARKAEALGFLDSNTEIDSKRAS